MDSENKFGLEIQQRLSKAENYNNWIFKNIKPFLGKRILEVGSSIGNFTRYFVDYGTEILIASDISEEYLNIINSNYHNLKNFISFKCDISDKKVLALKDHEIDTVVCMNVLEHVENDDAALSNIKELLIKSGCLILLVPAMEALFGSMDIADNHYRRYNKETLAVKIGNAGLFIEKSYYFNFLGVFGWFVNGKLLKRTIIPKNQLLFYDKLIPFISGLEDKIRIPFGQSIIYICRRR